MTSELTRGEWKEGVVRKKHLGWKGVRCGAREVGGPPKGLRVRPLEGETRGVHTIAPDAHVGEQHEARRS